MKSFLTACIVVVAVFVLNLNMADVQESAIPQLCVDLTGGFKNDRVEIWKDGWLGFSDKDVSLNDSGGRFWCTKDTDRGRRHEIEIRINHRVFHFNLVMEKPSILILVSRSQDGTSTTFTLTPQDPSKK